MFFSVNFSGTEGKHDCRDSGFSTECEVMSKDGEAYAVLSREQAESLAKWLVRRLYGLEIGEVEETNP